MFVRFFLLNQNRSEFLYLKMNKNKLYNRKKGSNCNKPLRQFGRGSSDAGESPLGPPKDHPGRPPPWLKGKALGLWYRDRNRENKKVEPTRIELDNTKKREIKHAISTCEDLMLNSDSNSVRKRAFTESFQNKINISFEEKLEHARWMQVKPDEKLDQELHSEFLKKRRDEKYKEMQEFRQKLPSYKERKNVLELIRQNQIILICGETGCGKTTQIVQYVLDDYILNEKGSLCTAVCTQPRRISAVSVADRVAAERAEKLGESVGYVIRLESQLPQRKRGTITFVTTGILIQWLESDSILSGITHLFIDEIHERNTLCDFLLTLLKLIIPKRPDLRVVLMSATLNAEQFSSYFNGIPCLEIPGFTYPVEEFYLEQILQMTNFRFKPPSKNDFNKMKNMKSDYETFKHYVLPYVRELEKSGMYSGSVIQELSKPESEMLNIEFLAKVIHHICISEPEGAILVFVPGLSAIQDLHRTLTQNRFFSPSKTLIVPMHSIMPTVTQKDAFRRPPQGVRKIVIATPIAETSITIDDVVYVIDSGRHKMSNFDIMKNVLMLNPEWETLANVKQRRGRAGRTQPGKCYKLFTRAREDTFAAYPIPEMQRTSLEEVILSAKMLQLGRVGPFLEKVMDPPDIKAVNLSLKLLQRLNALDSEERLTPLGFHLAKLPMDPQIGKMILMGALFGCLDPVLSIAACLSFKDPFIFVLNKEVQVDEKRRRFSRGEKSDHYMLSEAMREWEEANSQGYGSDFAYENFLSGCNMQLLKNMKKQFAGYLQNMNFLVNGHPKCPKSNVNSDNVSLIKAIVCSGLYPNVAVIQKTTGTVLMRTVDHPTVKFHKKSVLDGVSMFESNFVVYCKKIQSSSIFLHDATMIHPMPLLFFGEKADVVQGEGGGYTVKVDQMINIACTKENAQLIQQLRDKLNWILELVTSNPQAVDWERQDARTTILNMIIDLITCEDNSALEGAEDKTRFHKKPRNYKGWRNYQ